MGEDFFNTITNREGFLCMQVISSTIALEMLSQVIEEPLKTVSKKVDASAYRAISAMSPEEQNDLIEFVRKEFRLDEAPQGE